MSRLTLLPVAEAAHRTGWDVRQLVLACGQGRIAGAVIANDGGWLVPSAWVDAQRTPHTGTTNSAKGPSVFVLLAVYFSLVLLSVILWFAAPGGLLILGAAMLIAGALVLAGRLRWGGSATGLGLAVASVFLGTCGTCGMLWDSTAPEPRNVPRVVAPSQTPSDFGAALEEALAQHERQAGDPLVATVLRAGEAFPNEAAVPEQEGEAIVEARRLNADPNFVALLAEPSEDRKFFFSVVGEAIARMDCFGRARLSINPSRAESPAMHYALDVMSVVAGTQRLPSSLAGPAREALQAAAGELLRSPLVRGGDAHDWTSLAVLLFPENADIRRQHLAAKRAGPFRYSMAPDCSTRPGLHRERLALLHLSRVTALTTTETARLTTLQRAEERRVRGERSRRRETISMYRRTIPGLPGSQATVRERDHGHAIEVAHVSCGAGAIPDLFGADFGVLNDVGITEIRCVWQNTPREAVRFDGE